MTEITPELIAHLRDLDKKASPAPWKDITNPNNPDMPCSIEDAKGGLVAEGEPEWESFRFHINDPVLTFIDLRNALPALLDDRDRLVAKNKLLHERLAEATGATAYEQDRDRLLASNPYDKEQTR